MWLAATGFVLSPVSATVNADDPVSSSVRFNREISRILQRRCVPCHAPGRLAMSLVAYRDVREWSRAIREEVVEQRMPPAMAAPGYGQFANALGLTSRETTTLLSWLDGGMPRGDEHDLPAPLDLGVGAGSTDPATARIELPEQTIPALEEIVVRRVTVDPRLTADRMVTAVVVRPGSRELLRGVLVYTGPGERSWAGAWLPWQDRFVAPPGRAFRLAKSAPLTVLLYYRGGENQGRDRSTIELQFAPPTLGPLESLRIETVPAASGTATTVATGRLVLKAATTIWALQPATEAATQSLELRAERLDGSIEVLLWMPTVRLEWPSVLVFQQPVTLPAGTVLSLTTRRTATTGASDRVLISAWSESR